MKLQRFGAFAAVLASVAFMGCSSDQGGETAGDQNSSIDFALTTAEGVVITSVNYDLNTQAGADVVAGSIPVPNPESTISLGIQSLAAGSYALAFSATGTLPNGTTVPCTSAPSLFALAASQNLTLPTITMTCTITNGVVDTTGSVNASVEVAVETITVGTSVETFTYGPTTAVAVDVAGTCVFPPIALQVVNSNAAISYAWTSSPDGAFGGTPLLGTYTCASGGTKTLTVTATDGTETASKSVSVVCDDSACTIAPIECGNGDVETGEECDEETPRCVDCEIVPVCGDSIVDAPEECDEGGVSTPTCNADCTIPPVVGSPCIECLTEAEGIASYYVTYCEPFAECATAQECVLESGCFSPAPGNCFCGPDLDNCILPTFTPVGPCAAEIRAGTGGAAASNEDVVSRLFDLSFPAGAGMALINAASTDATCGPICAPEL